MDIIYTESCRRIIKGESCLAYVADAVIQHVLGNRLVDVVHVVHVSGALPGDLEHRPQGLVLALALVLLVHLCLPAVVPRRHHSIG